MPKPVKINNAALDSGRKTVPQRIWNSWPLLRRVFFLEAYRGLREARVPQRQAYMQARRQSATLVTKTQVWLAQAVLQPPVPGRRGLGK